MNQQKLELALTSLGQLSIGMQKLLTSVKPAAFG